MVWLNDDMAHTFPPPYPRVVLVHGLFMGCFAMRYLAKTLRAAGFEVDCFAYNTVTGSLQSAAERLVSYVHRDSGRVILVGHSLGGLVSMHASQNLETSRLHSVVLLGCPYQGAAAARVLRKLTGGRRSRVAQALADWALLTEKPQAPVPVYTLSGTRSAGLGRVVCGFREPNDGTVSVAETYYPGATSCVLPVSHTGMLFDARAAAQVVSWVRR